MDRFTPKKEINRKDLRSEIVGMKQQAGRILWALHGFKILKKIEEAWSNGDDKLRIDGNSELNFDNFISHPATMWTIMDELIELGFCVKEWIDYDDKTGLDNPYFDIIIPQEV